MSEAMELERDLFGQLVGDVCRARHGFTLA
jgi:hypothetical protein